MTLKLPKVKESQIQKQISDWLQYQENLGRLIFIRNNSFAGVTLRNDGSKGYVKNNKKGSSDFIVWKKEIKDARVVLPNGRTAKANFYFLDTYFIEVKRDKDSKQSKEQEAFEKKVKSMRGNYYVVHSLKEVERIIG